MKNSQNSKKFDNITVEEFFEQFKKLNPKTDLSYSEDISDPKIIVGKNVKELTMSLPNGFYVKEDNVTNKHNTTTGEYLTVKLSRKPKEAEFIR